MAKEIISGIYKITNKVNNKVYIGQSVDIKNRWTQHRSDFKRGVHHNKYFQNSWNKHGKDNFLFEIVEVCEEKYLNSKEKDWIEYYNSTKVNIGYNSTNGGDSCNSFSESAKEAIRRGVSNNKPIYQIDFEGNIIEEWEYGVSEASKKLKLDSHSILRCCKKEMRTCNNYIWIYKNEYDSNFSIDNYLNIASQPKQILQMDKDNNIIKTWNNSKDIERELGYFSSNICRICRNKKGTSNSYRWIFAKDYQSLFG